MVTQEEEQMVWTVLDEDWRAARGDVLVRGLEEMGLQFCSACVPAASANIFCLLIEIANTLISMGEKLWV